MTGVRRGHAGNHAGGGDDAVVGTEDRGPQPSNALGTMSFGVTTQCLHPKYQEFDGIVDTA
ncbi:MAG: hypothetical protein ABI460_15195 [Caldimonas sp.]